MYIYIYIHTKINSYMYIYIYIYVRILYKAVSQARGARRDADGRLGHEHVLREILCDSPWVPRLSASLMLESWLKRTPAVEHSSHIRCPCLRKEQTLCLRETRGVQRGFEHRSA